MIKVCGMRDAQNIRELDAVEGVDMMGFLFWPGSKRYVAEMPEYLPVNAKRVGVFVDAEPEEIAEKVREYCLNYVQLHGEEDLAYVSRLRTALSKTGLPMPRIVRSIAVGSRSQVLKAMMWDGYVDGILFETPTVGYGSSGIAFDWSLLSSYRGRTPFFLSGGISPKSLEALKEFEHPMWLGLDLNSRFEKEVGIKDVALIKDFVTEIRAAHLQGNKKHYEL